jgi:hypothetical protein
MTMLLIEYRVADFAGWKAVFDQDPMGRKPHGVTPPLAVPERRRSQPPHAEPGIPFRQGGEELP